MSLPKTWSSWFHGLAAAIIGGGSGAVTSAISVNLIDPQDWNLQGGLSKLLTLMAVTFVLNGLLSMFAYLKQSPLPQEEN